MIQLGIVTGLFNYSVEEVAKRIICIQNVYSNHKIVFSFLSVLLLLTTLSSFSLAEEKIYSCYKLTKEPVLDGRVRDDLAWENIPEATGFVALGGNTSASKQTSFKMGYSAKGLYVGIECEEPEVKKIEAKLKDMESLWCEDSIEVFLSSKRADNYFQFIVNTIDSRWSYEYVEVSVRGSKIPLRDWQAKVYKGENYYSVEIKIPLGVFLAIPKKGEEWTGNIARNIYTSGDIHTTWAHLKNHFHEPDNFGKVIFADKFSKKEIRKAKDETINFLKKKIAADLQSVSEYEKEISEKIKDYPSLRKVNALFLKDYEKIEKRLSQLDTTKEAQLLLKNSQNLLISIKSFLQIRDSRWPLLLVDKTLIKENKGVSLTVCEAVKYPGNPVVRLGKPGSVDEVRCHFDGSVYYMDGKFRMWYWAFPGGNAYAESDDGIHWVKPNLGLVDFRGNKNNNLVPMPGRPIFFYDSNESNPKKRYKKAVGKGDPNAGGRESLWTFAYSPDGFQWEIEERPLPNVWRWAESEMLTRVGKTWIIHTQTLKPGIGRAANAYYSDDLNKDLSKWKEKIAWQIPEGLHKHYQAHHGIKPWARPGLTIGLYGIFCDRHELRDTTCDLGLVLSQDGFNFWEPWPLATIIRRGPAGSWDSMFLMHGSPSFINVGNKTYIYYGGEDTGNSGERMQIGLATLHRDGFGYLEIRVGWNYWKKGDKTGEFVTVPIRLHDKKIEKILLNIDNLNSNQWVKVELLDEKGQPIPGYRLEEADKVTTNGIAVPATWKGNASLRNVPTDIIHLGVQMQGGQCRRNSPQLYAIYFYQPKHIEQ